MLSSAAVKKMYEEKENLIIIGLTGRTGAGCSKVAEILNIDDYQDLDLRTAKRYDYENDEERKLYVVHKFMKANSRWKKFDIIDVSSLIINKVLDDKKIDRLIQFIEYLNNSHKIEDLDLSGVKQELKTLESKLCFLDESDVNDTEKEFVFYTKNIIYNKKLIKNCLEKYSCRIKGMDGEHTARLYTYLMQNIGNNYRKTGKINGEGEFLPDKYTLFAEEIDNVIKIICKYRKQENSARGQDNNMIRICVDAIRNPYEALYLRDNYRCFYLIAINTKDNDRKTRLKELSDVDLRYIDSIENLEDDKSAVANFYHQNIKECFSIADIHIFNPNISNRKFYRLTEQLLKYIALMIHPGLISPSKIERSMQIAYNARMNSGCLSRQVGAVVTREDYSIQSVGWNDVPQGQTPCNLRDVSDYCKIKDAETFSKYELENEKFHQAMEHSNKKVFEGKTNSEATMGLSCSCCFKDVYNGITGKNNQVHTRALHAEENAFLQISKYGGTEVKGGCLFTTASPCELCAKKAYQLGIRKIYYIDPYPGISENHILTFGEFDNPKMYLFEGAIGWAFIELYSQRMALKDELQLITNVDIKKEVTDCFHKSKDKSELEMLKEFVKSKNLDSDFKTFKQQYN